MTMQKVLITVIAVFAFAAVSQAGISLQNGSFETPNEPRSASVEHTRVDIGWQAYGSEAILVSNAFMSDYYLTPLATAGDQSAELLYADSSLAQHLGTTAVAGTNVTFSFSYGLRSDMTGDNIVVGLYDAASGGNVLAEKNISHGIAGDWYADAVSATGIAAGTDVYARMKLLGDVAGNSFTLFDNMSVSATPESGISVTNGSFETPEESRYSWVAQADKVSLEWQAHGNNIILVSNTFMSDYYLTPLATAGDQMVELYYDNSSMSQNLGTVAVDGTNVSMSFSYGARSDATVDDVVVGLYDAAKGGNILGEVTLRPSISGDWYSDTVTASGISAGTEVFARMKLLDNEAGASYTLFDDVSVSATPGSGISVTNGSFETPEESRYSWVQVEKIDVDNWSVHGHDATLVADAYMTELGVTPDTAVDGDQRMELYYVDSSISQSLGTVEAGEESLTLSFSYSIRDDSVVDDFVVGLYDAANGGNMLGETTITPASVGSWFSDSVTAEGIPIGTEVFARIKLLDTDATVTRLFIDDVSVSTAGPIPGDANDDGKVDVSDLGILATNYGMTSGMTWELGDFTGDGKVDVSDLGILATNYGAGTVAGSSVPEPGAIISLLSGMLVLGTFYRRRLR